MLTLPGACWGPKGPQKEGRWFLWGWGGMVRGPTSIAEYVCLACAVGKDAQRGTRG